MTNTLKLKAAIVGAGLTQSVVAKALGISTQGFFKKLHNKSEFLASEILKLCEILKISNRDEIFFAS